MNYLDLVLPIFEHYAWLAYFFILALSFFESFVFLGIVIPGTALLIAAGFIASQGFFNFGTLFIFSLVGAVAGDSASFYLGKHSARLFKPDSRIFRLDYLEKGKSFVAKYGNRSVFLSRFVGPLRPIVPFLVGIFKMDGKKFFFYNIASAIIWSAGYLWLGYFFGWTWEAVSLWSTRIGAIIFWLVVFLAAFFILRWLLIKKGRAVFRFFISLAISVGEGIKDNPDIQRFFEGHPILAKFLQKRFDRRKFSGLKLTILVLLFIYVNLSFLGLIKNVFINGSFLSIDLSLANLLHVFRNPLLIKIFLWITLLGKWQIVLPLCIAAIIIFWNLKRGNYILPFFISTGGSLLSGFLGKYLWQRPRPMAVAVYTEGSWSFPSEHAIIAVSLYGFLVYFFWKYFKKWRQKINTLFFGLLTIIFIGFSRLYLGVHYLSDVWAGNLVGAFWLLIGIALVESKVGSGQDGLAEEVRQVKYPTKVIIPAAIVFLASIYLWCGFNYRPLFNLSEEVASRKFAVSNVGEIFTEHKLPQFTETLLGNPQEPFSFIIIAKDDQHLIKSFKKAEWFLAENVNFNSLLNTFKFEVLNQAYPTAPMTPYFWQTYTNDFGFEQPTEVNTARYRHHARFWRVDSAMIAGKNIYVGIASLDTGVKWWGLTHKIKPDIDSERDYLFKSLTDRDVISKFSQEQFVDPVLGKNFTGDQFFTDGKIYIIYLK